MKCWPEKPLTVRSQFIMINIERFYQEQLRTWQLARDNYEQLNSLVYKEFVIEGVSVIVQFNPSRIRSAQAVVDEKSIAQRPCFLCPENRPKEQMSIQFPPYYDILVNPYPIFSRHLTIAENRHMPQLVKGRMSDMLNLATTLTGYTILYNGPESGASAPDHFHFQACKSEILPIEKEISNPAFKEKIIEEELGEVYYMKNYLRKAFVYKSEDKNWLLRKFDELYKLLHKFHPDTMEPKFNIITWCDQEIGYLIVFPRRQHRPRQFYETGAKQLLISPGVVDMAGQLIVVREEDYKKMNEDVIADIYSQITISDEEEKNIVEQLRKR